MKPLAVASDFMRIPLIDIGPVETGELHAGQLASATRPMGAWSARIRSNRPWASTEAPSAATRLPAPPALAAIDFTVETRLADQARDKGEYVVDKLSRHAFPNVREIRHLGLMAGIELKEKAQPYLVKLMEQGVLAMPAGATVLRFLPPLTTSRDELDIVAEKVIEVLPKAS